MALTQDYVYEVGIVNPTFTCLIRALAGINTDERAGEEAEANADHDFHVRVQQNENEFGIHPRYALLARTINGAGGNSCLVQKGAIYKKLPILSLARFNEITVFDGIDASNAPSTAAITLAHKPDGTGLVNYIVVGKQAEYWN